MLPGTDTHPGPENPAEARPRPVPPGGAEIIARSGLGDVIYLLDLGVPLTEIARRMCLTEEALTEALKLAENNPHR